MTLRSAITTSASKVLKINALSLPMRLTAEDLMVDLWYSPQREWVALESPTDGGRLRCLIQ